MTMHAHALAPYQAAQIARRGEKLLQRRLITAHQYALFQIMLWRARKPGSATLMASMRVLAQLAGQARSTVIEGLKRLEELGLIARIRRRARVVWLGSVASRVIANAYRMIAPDTETGRQAVSERRASKNYICCRGADRCGESRPGGLGSPCSSLAREDA
jgi:hypothetical protein